MKNIDVSPIEIRDYAISYGWILVREALRDGLYVLNSPTNDFRQLIFPIDNNKENFNELAEISLAKLANFTQKTFFKILEEIREVNDDVISLRYYSDSKIINSLSFQEALDSIESTKQMILAASSSVINPSLFHKRMSRTEAVEVLKASRFRHTEEGSFILKISCPVQIETSYQQSLFEEDNVQKPISRRAFEIINNGANKIIESIEGDYISELFEEQKNSSSPFISYNLCDAIIGLFDDERELPFELRFDWSRAYLRKINSPPFPRSVKFPYSLKTKIEELKSYFQPETRDTSDVFFGSVENLYGNVGDDGRRAGEVTLRLYIEGEMVNARANLNSDLYDKAYQAHGIEGGGLVKIKGILRPAQGRRTKSLTDISQFDIIPRE